MTGTTDTNTSLLGSFWASDQDFVLGNSQDQTSITLDSNQVSLFLTTFISSYLPLSLDHKFFYLSLSLFHFPALYLLTIMVPDFYICNRAGHIQYIGNRAGPGIMRVGELTLSQQL